MKKYIIPLVMLLLMSSVIVADPIGRDDFSPDAIVINFDQFPDGSIVPNHTVITTHYEQWGVLFSGPVDPTANGDHQYYYGPLASPPNVLLEGGSEIWLDFVHPVSGLPAPTSAVGADIIFRDTGTVSMLEVFDDSGIRLGSVTSPPDTGIGDEIFIGFADPIIYSAIFYFNPGDDIVGIDNLILEPVPEPDVIEVDLDIKPGSCPNPLNVRSKGVLPVAILGSENFDVSMIDVASIRLADVAPIRSNYEDVAAPVIDGQECECTTEGPDGYLDLTLKFKTQDIVQALGEVVNGETLVLTLTGESLDGTPIEGADCIRVKKPRAKKPKK